MPPLRRRGLLGHEPPRDDAPPWTLHRGSNGRKPMNAGSLRTVVAAGCVALAAAACGSTRGGDPAAREKAIRSALSGGLGFTGRQLVMDLGQHASMRLRPEVTRLEGDMLLVEDVHHRLTAVYRDSTVPKWAYHGLEA